MSENPIEKSLAREEAAYARGQEQMRERAATLSEIQYKCPDYPDVCDDFRCYENAGREIGNKIRSLELTEF